MIHTTGNHSRRIWNGFPRVHPDQQPASVPSHASSPDHSTSQNSETPTAGVCLHPPTPCSPDSGPVAPALTKLHQDLQCGAPLPHHCPNPMATTSLPFLPPRTSQSRHNNNSANTHSSLPAFPSFLPSQKSPCPGATHPATFSVPAH